MRKAFSGFWKRTALALVLALALRLFLVYLYPHAGGDSEIYVTFARNLLEYGTYSHLDPVFQAAPQPTLIRAPGYPLMIAAVLALAGKGNETAVRVAQAVLDTFTCLLAAFLAFEIASGEDKRRRRIAQRALLLAAICPFIGNYAASILTEVPTTLFWTAATLFGLRGLKNEDAKQNWIYCGIFAGVATLFRPESGILIGIFGLVLLFRQYIRRAWKPFIRGAAWMGLGLLLPLAPWAIRNAVSLKTFQLLAPKYAQGQNETVTLGYFDWCRTWIWTYQDIAHYLWPLEYEAMPTGSLPPASFDNENERKTVLALYNKHNRDGFYLAPESDQMFARIAAERRTRNPFRFYIELPFLRSIAMWFTPRVEILSYDSRLLPAAEAWEDSPVDFAVALILFLLNLTYVVLGIIGTVSILKRWRAKDTFEKTAVLVLIGIAVTRTAFLSFFFFPEPRYILEVYPCIFVLGAFAFKI